LAETLTGVNGEIIKWAREFYNMTSEEAANAIGVNVEKYSAWENGVEFPTYAKLRKISDIFRKPSALFFFPSPPELPQVKGDLRTLSTEVVSKLSKNIIIQFEKAKAYQLNLRELYGERSSILCNRSEFPKDTDELCNYLREIMSFPIDVQKKRKSAKVVFEIFRDKFYELGIYVFKDSFKDNNVSGLCLNDDHYPIIIINNSMSFARQNFTLFHELFHLLSDTSGAEIIRDDYYVYLNDQQTTDEKACDIFANSFLVPLSDFTQELNKLPLSDKRIEELSELYSVSKEAIMYKLLNMGKITHQDYDRLKEVFYGDALRNPPRKKDEKSGGNYYLTKLSYLGHQYTRDVFREYFSGRIDNVRTSEMLNSKIDHLPKLETAFYRGVK